MGRSLSHRGKLQQNGEAGWFRRLESFCCLALVARPTSLAAGTEPDRFFLSRKRLVLSCAFYKNPGDFSDWNTSDYCRSILRGRQLKLSTQLSQALVHTP